MFLCDNTQFIIVMHNLSQATTAKDSINQLLAENNRDELVKLAKMVGSVVAKMHQSGLIHGDLTSSNILVENTAESAYQLAMIDFGLSSLVREREMKMVKVKLSDCYIYRRDQLRTRGWTCTCWREPC